MTLNALPIVGPIEFSHFIEQFFKAIFVNPDHKIALESIGDCTLGDNLWSIGDPSHTVHMEGADIARIEVNVGKWQFKFKLEWGWQNKRGQTGISTAPPMTADVTVRLNNEWSGWIRGNYYYDTQKWECRETHPKKNTIFSQMTGGVRRRASIIIRGYDTYLEHKAHFDMMRKVLDIKPRKPKKNK